MNVRSQLSPIQGMSFWGAEQIRQQAARMWKEKRIAMIWVDEIADDFERQAVINVANRQAGE